MSQLYLAVPESLAQQAVNRVENNSDLNGVGIITVATDGTVNFIRHATTMESKYDGYLKRFEKRRVGYGELDVMGSEQIENPYITEEEAERFRDPDAEVYAKGVLEDYSESRIKSQSHFLSDQTEDELDKTGVRCYLLWGVVPNIHFVSEDSQVEQDGMKQCYINLRISQFTIDNKPGFKFKFGPGGYIWFRNDASERLLKALSSIKNIQKVNLTGHGQIIKLDDIKNGKTGSHNLTLDGQHGSEKSIQLQIRSLIGSGTGDRVLEMDLGKGEKTGAVVEFTRPQWHDIITTLHMLLNERSIRELPGKEEFSRIGPSGDDTWDLGFITQNPDAPPPEEWE